MRLTEIEVGYRFEDIKIDLPAWRVQNYQQSVGDDADYGGQMAPLSCLAVALGALVDVLPHGKGLVHLSQQVDWLATVDAGADIVAKAVVESVRERRGSLFMTIGIKFFVSGTVLIRAATTVVITT